MTQVQKDKKRDSLCTRQMSPDPGTRSQAIHDEEAQQRIIDREEERTNRAASRERLRFWQTLLATVLTLLSGGAWFFSALKSQPIDNANIIAALAAVCAALIVIWRGD